jgi:hypothetical protein
MSTTEKVVNTLTLSRPNLAARLAAFFHEHPNEFIDGRQLATIGGSYAWRTRISDLRRAPFDMRIENRQRHQRVNGELVTISEYRYRPHEQLRPATETCEQSPWPAQLFGWCE